MIDFEKETIGVICKATGRDTEGTIFVATIGLIYGAIEDATFKAILKEIEE